MTIKKTLLLVLAAHVAASAVCPGAEAQVGRAARAGTQTSNRAPAITVNGRTINWAQYQRALDQDVLQSLARFGIGSGIDPRDTELTGLRRHLEAQTRERLTNWLVLLDAAKKARIRVPADSVTAAWRQVATEYPTDSELQAALRQSGRTRAEVMQDIRDNLTIDLFLRRRIGEPTVTDTEVRAFYERNKERYSSPETVRARHILIRDTGARDRIAAIRARIVAGADFATMAREHSQDGSAQAGGDLGTFRRGQMVPPFEEAAFSLPVGQVSQPIETQFGWHLIKVEEHRAAETPEFEEVRQDAERRIASQKRAEAVRELIASLKSRAHIRVHLPALPAPAPAPPPSMPE